MDDFERILEQLREHHAQGTLSETWEERGSAHRHLKRNEMDTEEHEGENLSAARTMF